MKKSLLFLSFFCFCALVKAQTEYLVTINSNNGNYTKIDSLPSVKWISISSQTFDNVNQRYIFRGSDANYNWALYSIDVNTGNIISNPLFPVLVNPDDNFVNFEYSDSMNKLFGLHWNSIQSKEYFTSINTATGVFTIIDSLPGVKWIQAEKAFDNNSNHYIFKGADENLNWYLYSLDANNGNIISNPLLTNSTVNLSELQFSNSINRLYALHWDNTLNTEFLSFINPTSGAYTDFSSIPGVAYISTGSSTFDDVNKRYIFSGGDSNGNWYLYSIDALTGNIISNPIFPILTNLDDNLHMIETSSLTVNYYALHWEANTVSAGILGNYITSSNYKFFPNPFIDNSKIFLDKKYMEIMIFIYNSNGQVVKKIIASNTSEISISRENLCEGQYFISVICDQIYRGTIDIKVQ